ncbi:fumarylacetoacetate hydrolase family protein [Nocardioides sp. SR21]|uniref:fumarylacetoacetate hydrolase family protein n=1 Tax=Nocardioides sp. SR21 TaxID=2919501 RepID=UPI001FA94F13|nr:fumarylacetoacetate hydrolase family protein [Nocardioides sp. SR21]
MKLATFIADGEERLGVVDTDHDQVLDARSAYHRAEGRELPALASMQALIDAGPDALALLADVAGGAGDADRRPLATTRLAAPLPRPRQIRDFLLFEKHVLNCLAEEARLTGNERPVPPAWYDFPTYYRGNPSTVIGHETDIQRPAYTGMLDFELEMGCIIGRTGKDISTDDALDHVFGFTIFNDVSARDMQMRMSPVGMGPCKGKDFDTSNVLGPWIVTRDEVGDPYDLRMSARVNGEEWGSGSSGEMQFSWSEVIAFISQSETLHPGEVLGSGTVGTGCGLEQGRFLEDGDVIELEIERVGTLRNKVT